MKLNRVFGYLLLATISVLAAGCVRAGYKKAGAARPAEITVASAASLKSALTDIAKDFEAKTGAKVHLTFGSSGLLARQIEKGAPFDLFFSANENFIDELASAKLVTKPKPYAKGFIVLIGKAKTHSDLTSPAIKKIAIANPKYAPYGQAAIEVLKNNGTWPDVKNKIVYAENVAQANEFVQTGNADTGFVALSLAKPAGTGYTRINQGAYKPLWQWVAVIKKTDRPKTAKAFIKYLEAPSSKQILESAGFEPTDPTKVLMKPGTSNFISQAQLGKRSGTFFQNFQEQAWLAQVGYKSVPISNFISQAQLGKVGTK